MGSRTIFGSSVMSAGPTAFDNVEDWRPVGTTWDGGWGSTGAGVNFGTDPRPGDRQTDYENGYQARQCAGPGPATYELPTTLTPKGVVKFGARTLFGSMEHARPEPDWLWKLKKEGEPKLSPRRQERTKNKVETRNKKALTRHRLRQMRMGTGRRHPRL